MKKKLLMLVSLVLFTGCTIKYELNVDGDYIAESVNIEIKSSEVQDSGLTSEEYIDNVLNSYNSIPEVKDYSTLKTKKKDSTYLTISNDYTNDGDYIESLLINQLFSNVSISENNNIKNLNLSGIIQKRLFDDDVGNYIKLEKLQFKFKFKNVVTSSNADKIDRINNVYTWNFDENTTLNQLEISYDTSKTFEPSVIDYLIAYKYFVIGGISVIIIGIVVTYIINKSKKNNEL